MLCDHEAFLSFPGRGKRRGSGHLFALRLWPLFDLAESGATSDCPECSRTSFIPTTDRLKLRGLSPTERQGWTDAWSAFRSKRPFFGRCPPRPPSRVVIIRPFA